VRSADIVREGPLELAYPCTGRQPPGAQGGGDFVDFFDTDTRRREGDREGLGIGLDVRCCRRHLLISFAIPKTDGLPDSLSMYRPVSRWHCRVS
jgi:hypothetical protein